MHRKRPPLRIENRQAIRPKHEHCRKCGVGNENPCLPVLLSHGYVVAEGQIQSVRGEVKDQPMQILVRCDHPSSLAARLFEQNHVVEAKLHTDGHGLLLRTTDADGFYLLLNRIVMDTGLEVESVAPADDDVNSVYQYLIGGEGATI